MKGARNLNPNTHEHRNVDAATTVTGSPGCIGVAEGLAPDQTLRLATELGYRHICQKSGLEYDVELKSSEVLVREPEAFFQNPICSVFSPTDVSRANERALILSESLFNSSNEKRQVLEQANNAMESKGLSRTLIEDITSVADEMFTNAIFNAPFIDHKTHKNPGVSRQDLEVRLEQGKFARLFLACDDKRLMVACEDPYGSLNLLSYFNKIKATYDRGAAATMNFGPGGAGLGSYIIFNTGASLFAGVHPAQATIIGCVLPLGMSNRKRALLPKHLHWIQL